MRQSELTLKHKQFIDANWQKMTYLEISEQLDFKSTFRVYDYCKKQGYSKVKKELTEEQKEFVRSNFLRMTENMMSKELEVGRSYIQKFKREEGLFSAPWNRDKNNKAKVKGLFFNVDEQECWVA